MKIDRNYEVWFNNHYCGKLIPPVLVVRLEDLKSAVQGLVKEIENTKFATSKHLQDEIRETVKNLIKKWLADVVSEDES